MTDQIKYDYAAMDDYYEDMLRASRDMEKQVDDLMDDAKALLTGTVGRFADGYELKTKEVRDLFAELNATMSTRAQELQAKFDEFGAADQKLGDGF